MNNQERELLEGFRLLCQSDKNTILATVSIAVSSEDDFWQLLAHEKIITDITQKVISPSWFKNT